MFRRRREEGGNGGGMRTLDAVMDRRVLFLSIGLCWSGSGMRQTSIRKLGSIPTEHPYVVRTEGVCGGRPRIRDSRIPVSTIAELYGQGEPVDEILATYPHLDPAAIHDAIGYYLDHQEDIDAEIDASSLEAVLAETGGVLGEDGVIRFVKKAG